MGYIPSFLQPTDHIRSVRAPIKANSSSWGLLEQGGALEIKSKRGLFGNYVVATYGGAP